VNLLFDLDGTLTDPVVGVTRCLQHAMSQLDRVPPPIAELSRFVGPPLRGTFAELLSTNDDALIARAIVLYRERFVTTGMLENQIYPAVRGGVEQLGDDGHRLWVVTSKPTVYARQIVGHFGLASWFREIYGSELDGRNTDKADLVRVALDSEGLVPRETWMIGDRAHDMRGGRINGTLTAGVLWGYGTEEELRAEEPDLLLASMPELVVRMRRSIRQRLGSS
jgi:phosphoglycolate phosphatase